jgi:putative lipoprotein
VKLGKVFIVVAVVTANVVTGACQSTSPSDAAEDPMNRQAKVTGKASYLAQMAMPPQAVQTVRLEDVSRADAPAVVLGEQVIRMEGRQVPIPFEIPYDPSKIDDRHRYVVRASIHLDGELVFTSTKEHPVLTQGYPATVEVLMQPVSQRPPTAAATTASDSPLVNTYWKLTELNRGPVTVAANQREPHVILQMQDNRFVGSEFKAVALR